VHHAWLEFEDLDACVEQLRVEASPRVKVTLWFDRPGRISFTSTPRIAASSIATMMDSVGTK